MFTEGAERLSCHVLHLCCPSQAADPSLLRQVKSTVYIGWCKSGCSYTFAPVKIVCLCGLDQVPGAKVQHARGSHKYYCFRIVGVTPLAAALTRQIWPPLALLATAPALKRVKVPLCWCETARRWFGSMFSFCSIFRSSDCHHSSSVQR